MNKTLRLVLIAGASVIAFDALASIASLQLGFEYSKAAIGSYLLEFVIGFFAGRAGGWKLAMSVGAVMGLVDATLGWLVSSLIGPGKPPVPLTAGLWIGVAITVIISAMICAGIGGAIGNAVRRREAPAA